MQTIAPYRHLPSLQALRCFEAAARLGSFSRAAKELCITHSAVSHQLRTLEEAIGHPLFQRQGNRMRLTVVGRTLAAETHRALDYLSQAYTVARSTNQQKMETITLAAQYGIIEHWIIPRLPQLKQFLGETGLRISSLLDINEACPSDTDIALVYGMGDVPGMLVEKISDEQVFPVCSPEFLKQNPAITLERINDFPLLLHSRTTWNLWLEKARLPISYPARPIFFDDVTLTIRGALEGHGIAMARAALVQDYLEEGRLVRLFELTVPGIFNYYIAWRTESMRSRFQALRSWIIAGLRPQEQP